MKESEWQEGGFNRKWEPKRRKVQLVGTLRTVGQRVISVFRREVNENCRSYGSLRSVYLLLPTDVSVQPIGSQI
jgi:hypothetical protein